jgi:transcriptional regulator with XRE-family HTH domain
MDVHESLQPWRRALGEEIRARRKQAGMSQDALAKAVGLKRRNMIARYEAGTDAPSVDLFGRIALTLGITEVSIDGSRFIVRSPMDSARNPPEQFRLDFDKEKVYTNATIKITPIKAFPKRITLTITAIASAASG